MNDITGAASDFVHDAGTGALLHATEGDRAIFGDPATRPDMVIFDGTEIVFSAGGSFVSNGGAITVGAFDFNASGTTGGNRLVSVGQDGAMTQIDVLAGNGGYAYGPAVEDINGDGNADILRNLNGGLETLENDGLGSFPQADTLTLSGFVFGEDLALV